MLLALLTAAIVVADGPLHEAEDRIIHYNEPNHLADPVACLRARLEGRKEKLRFEPARGYLASLLRALRIPVSSQTLVFSKTSLQSELVGPRTPRAVYFNDSVYVSWVPGGSTIDITSTDPEKGPVFYTLDQQAPVQPRFARGEQCFQCHLAPETLNVPGPLVRSMIVAPDGRPLSQVDDFITGDGSRLKDRWGGWYVTATQASFEHLGNSFANQPHPTGALPSLRGRIDTSRYLSPGSDIVALLVLTHQMKMQNLITRANYETRFALSQESSPAMINQRIARVAEPLLQYLLFRNETHLAGPVRGGSPFAGDFQKSGPWDSKHRSLRQLDLETRLMRYPCSYLIYSPAIDALPVQLKTYLWRRLFEILSGEDKSKPYAAMSADDRLAVLEILRDTKPEFAATLPPRPRTAPPHAVTPG